MKRTELHGTDLSSALEMLPEYHPQLVVGFANAHMLPQERVRPTTKTSIRVKTEIRQNHSGELRRYTVFRLGGLDHSCPECRQFPKTASISLKGEFDIYSAYVQELWEPSKGVRNRIISEVIENGMVEHVSTPISKYRVTNLSRAFFSEEWRERTTHYTNGQGSVIDNELVAEVSVTNVNGLTNRNLLEISMHMTLDDLRLNKQLREYERASGIQSPP